MIVIDKSLRSGEQKVDSYIESLETWIQDFEASNIKKLISACDDVAGIIADDVTKLGTSGDAEEIDNELLMLGSKKNKIYERFLSLVSQIKHFKTISDLLEDMKPKVQESKESSTPVSSDAKKEELEPKTPLRISDMAKIKPK